LAEIDAPEKAQAFGARSKESLAHVCFQSRAEVRPETKDRYGRTVARVTCDGIDASVYQVENGMAWYSRRYGKDPIFRPLEADAVAAKRGLWVQPHPIPPWEWRRMPRH
jgi:endonuclease YncB( thermonuclease family)